MKSILDQIAAAKADAKAALDEMLKTRKELDEYLNQPKEIEQVNAPLDDELDALDL